MKNHRFTAWAAIISILLFSPTVNAQTLNEWLTSEQSSQEVVEYDHSVAENDYISVLSQYEKNGYQRTGDSFRIEPAQLTDSGKSLSLSEYNGEDNVLLWEADNEFLTFSFQVEQAGLYALRVRYCAVNDATTSIVRSLAVDGTVPFNESGTVTLYRQWEDDGEPTLNADGDEVRPGVDQKMIWQTTPVYDAEGAYSAPLEWYLSEGTHTLTLSIVDNPMALRYLEFYTLADIPSYDELRDTYGTETAAESIPWEAEQNIIGKNLSVIRSSSDSEPSVLPTEAGKVRINVIGGTAWQEGHAEIVWSFEVKESGLYQLAFHAIQNYNNGLPVYRRIMIDGEVPFREMEAVRFQYDRKWQTYTLGRGEDEPYLFYLEKGSHTLSMAAVQGDSAEIIRQINQDSQKLSSAILQITMLTGQNPDPNYDYQVETRIPGLMDTLNGLADSLELCMEQIAQISGGRPSLYSQLNMAKEQINDLIRDPYSIPVKIGDLNNLLSTYGTAISTLSAQPLMLDRIFLVPADQEVPVIRSSFWARLWGGILNFFNSFTKDYDSVGLSGGGEVTHTLDVWVARGKDWGALIQELADSDFTPAHGVGINIHIVPAGQLNSGSANTLLLAISSGMAPDIGLGVDVNSVGEFAIRNAVVDVSRFEDYDEVMTRFNPKFSIPLTYRGRVYGLPETQNFKVLFYRKDILSELGIGIPETWTDLYNHVLPVLNQNNMQFYYAVDSDPFVYQLGGRYYNDDYTESALDSAETYQGLKEMFELYTVYGVPVSANFFNRFRTGEIPMGIGNFSNYMQIRSAAPEIAGRWGIAVMPGHLREDGTVNHSQGAAVAEAAMIMSQTEYPEDAWEFLKWWMSDDIQKQFGNEIEAQNGETARWNTANTAAFESMPWPQEDLRVIREALSQCDQTEVVLGGYFSTRHVVNAYNRTCISGTMNTRESIEAAVKDINKELLRKRQSAGLDEKEDTES